MNLLRGLLIALLLAYVAPGNAALITMAGARLVPVVSGSCPNAANTAGGSDGQGGCFPSTSTTGVPSGTSLTSYTTPCTITTNGTTINARTVNCSELVINANSVTITNSKVNGPIVFNGNGLTVTDTEIDATPTPGVFIAGYSFDGDSGVNVTFTRVNLHGGRSNWNCPNSCTARDSISWGVEIASNDYSSHMSAFRFEQNSTFIHNTIACDKNPPNYPPMYNPLTDDSGGCSANLTGYPDFAPIHDLTVTNNLFVANPGASVCMYGGNSGPKPFSGDPLQGVNIHMVNNVFQIGASGKCAAYGFTTDFGTMKSGFIWTNNRKDDGTTLTPNDF